MNQRTIKIRALPDVTTTFFVGSTNRLLGADFNLRGGTWAWTFVQLAFPEQIASTT
jgi:hypothetical protein